MTGVLGSPGRERGEGQGLPYRKLKEANLHKGWLTKSKGNKMNFRPVLVKTDI